MKQLFLQGLFIFVLSTSRPYAGWADPQLTVGQTPSNGIRVGESCELWLQIEWPSEEGDYNFQLPELTLTNLILDQFGESNQTFHKGAREWRKKEFRFTLLPQKPGPASVGPFRIPYLDPQKQTGGHLNVQSLSLRVGGKRVPTRTGLLLFSLLGAGSCLAIGLWRHPKKCVRETPLRSTATLEEKYLTDMALPERANVSSLGRLFGNYLKEKFSISGPFTTHREVLKQLETRLSREELKDLRDLIERFEEISYAKNTAQIEKVTFDLQRYLQGKKEIEIKS